MHYEQKFMKNNRLSIIIPVYNASQYIIRCLDSIYAIGLRELDFEIIVIDDCSTDDTFDILQDYAFKHANMRVCRQPENRRQGAARNRGIDLASGNYITFCDADDYMLAEGVMNALHAVEKSHADVCYFEMEYQNGSDDAWHLVEMPEATHNTIMSSKEYLENYYSCYYNGPVRCLYRTEFLKGTHIRFVEGVRWEDCDWTVKVYAKANEIQFVDGVGYRYAWNGTATSKQADAQAMVEQLKAGIRLAIFAEEIKTSLTGLSEVLLEEARYRYVIQNIRLRNLTKFSASDIRYVYNNVSASEWEEIDMLCLPMWERLVVQYHTLALLILCAACPLAAIGRKVMELKRKIK